MINQLEAVVRRALDAEQFTVQPVSGGDINRAARVELADGTRVLVKYNASAPSGFFAAEAHGLAELKRGIAQAGARLRVPDVIAHGEAGDDIPAFLALQWLERGEASADFGETFGRALAALHRVRAQQFGFAQDNFIGRLPQRNTPTPTWIAFYREQRLLPQIALARHNGLLPAPREKPLMRLIERLDEWIGASVPALPSLLHGDLWAGNYLVGDPPALTLIDPAVYYGEREVELAFTELFGGFPRRFYDAYHEAWPLDAGYARRKALYQLYPLLVHLNLFGESYGASVDAVCRKYTG